MKFKTIVTITYEKEIDTDWYENAIKEEALKLINLELKEALDIMKLLMI